MSTIRNNITSSISKSIYSVDSYFGASTYIEFDLTDAIKTASLLNVYSGSQSRSGNMYYFDEDSQTFYSWSTNEISIADGIGYCVWPVVENKVASGNYRTFDSGDWTATNCSVGGSVELIDGSTGIHNTVIASGADATLMLSAHTLTSAYHAVGFYIKRKTGTGAISVTLDNGATWTAVTIDSAWSLCYATQNLANPQIGIKISTSGDEIYIDWAQLVVGRRPPSFPVPGGDTHGAQTLILADASNASRLINNAKGTIYIELKTLPDDYGVSVGRIIENGDNILYIDDYSDALRSNDGTSTISFPGAFLGYSKIALAWNGTNMQLTSNGSSSSAVAYDGDWGSGDINCGSRSGPSFHYNGIVSKIRFYPDFMSQSTREVLTTP